MSTEEGLIGAFQNEERNKIEEEDLNNAKKTFDNSLLSSMMDKYKSGNMGGGKLSRSSRPKLVTAYSPRFKIEDRIAQEEANNGSPSKDSNDSKESEEKQPEKSKEEENPQEEKKTEENKGEKTEEVSSPAPKLGLRAQRRQMKVNGYVTHVLASSPYTTSTSLEMENNKKEASIPSTPEKSEKSEKSSEKPSEKTEKTIKLPTTKSTFDDVISSPSRGDKSSTLNGTSSKKAVQFSSKNRTLEFDGESHPGEISTERLTKENATLKNQLSESESQLNQLRSQMEQLKKQLMEKDEELDQSRNSLEHAKADAARLANMQTSYRDSEVFYATLETTNKLLTQSSLNNLDKAIGIIEDNSELKKRLLTEMKQRRLVSDKLEALEEDLMRIRGKFWLNYNRTAFFAQLLFWLLLLFLLWRFSGTSFSNFSTSKSISGTFRR